MQLQTIKLWRRHAGPEVLVESCARMGLREMWVVRMIRVTPKEFVDVLSADFLRDCLEQVGVIAMKEVNRLSKVRFVWRVVM